MIKANKFEKLKRVVAKKGFIFKISLSIFLSAILLILFFVFNAWIYFEPTTYASAMSGQPFQVHVIDVDNGDAILIKTPNNKTIMIDTGNIQYIDTITSYINQYMHFEGLGNTIDYLVLTHTDVDHIGNANEIIERYNVVNLYRPKIYSISENKYHSLNYDYDVYDGQEYDNAISSAYMRGCNIFFSEAGIICEQGGVEIEFLAPLCDSYTNSNNYSAVIMLRYNGNKFLFMGDAEKSVEEDLVEKYGDKLKADVLKVGHHGSQTSTSDVLLKTVAPDVALLSCSDSSTIFPNAEVYQLLKKNCSKIISTAENGSFVISTVDDKIKYSYAIKPFNYYLIICSGVIISIFIVWAIPFHNEKNFSKAIKK